MVNLNFNISTNRRNCEKNVAQQSKTSKIVFFNYCNKQEI